MACYHLNASIISRGHGKSIAAASAYISGERLRDVYEGRVYDRSYRRDVVHKEILLPPDASPKLQDRQTLLDALNYAEKRIDSQTARSINLALPDELSLSEQVKLVREFVWTNFNRYGLCADVAIHQGKLEESRKPASIEPVLERKDNRHAHIIVPFRPVSEDGFCRTKEKNRFMNTRSYLASLRQSWADIQNREFQRRGLSIRVSHESLAAQGIDREPTKHIGAAAMALEQKGIRTERGDQYREVIAHNRSRELKRQRFRQRYERNSSIERTR